jgi:hypothetical protein
MLVQLPPTAVGPIQALPRVARLVPVQSYRAGDAIDSAMVPDAGGPRPLPPIDTSTDSLNHNCAAAWGILGSGGNPYRGAGARIAVFDTGIDADVDGTNSQADPHPAFVDDNGVTRVEAFLQAGGAAHADINICQIAGGLGTTGPHGWRLNVHNQIAAHGTAMAAIAAGRSYAGFVGTGHAPDAGIVDVACATVNLQSSSPPPALGGWTFTDASLLLGIEVLREFVLLQGASAPGYVDVVNLSLNAGLPPNHPVTVALDQMAREDDMLLVSIAGNDRDNTTSALGFYHGLAVGSVHARQLGGQGRDANLAFLPMMDTSRGPHFSDTRRLFPDVCATGAGPGSFDAGNPTRRFRYPGSFNNLQARGTCLLMPGVDIADTGAASVPANNVSPLRYNRGTSEACAQVSGAAALYRGSRPTATAEEARAALLLNVLGTFVSVDGTTADTSTQHTYTNRNTYGVGYVRDDLLAQFAVRASAIKPLAQVVTLDHVVPSATVTYGGLQAGKRYGVVACWRRYQNVELDSTTPELELANVDLEILSSGGSVLARSATPANAYERLVLRPPGEGTTSLVLRVFFTSAPRTDQALAVQLVAREFADELDPATAVADPVHAATGQVQIVSSGAGCVATAQDWSVQQIIPTLFSNLRAYGDAPLAWLGSQATFFVHAGYRDYLVSPPQTSYGLNLGGLSHVPGAYKTLHIQMPGSDVPNGMVLAGLAFRTWAPFAPTADLTLTEVKVWRGQHQAANGPPPAAMTVASNFVLKAPGTGAGVLDNDSFQIVLPFAAPYTAASGQPFHIWITTASNAPAFPVDAVWVPFAPFFSTMRQAGGTFVRLDQAPMIGLIPASASAAYEPRLRLFMEPWSSNSATGCEVGWILDRSPANQVVALMSGGFATTPAPFPPCLSWLTGAQTLGFFVTDAAGMQSGRITIPPQFVHFDYGYQVALSPTLFSNAVRVTLGGGL